ncbi:MAG: UDP-N-acetylglucosamine 2-epimerase (hydrolyzing) [Planctomycetes bacterium]|nr:UDP-N-acetylglucosamine 2-epimerase (hydrolyzing) [Planctomycetota bacterium]
MSNRRTIAVVTGSRAEYGLLAPVMRAIADRSDLSLRVLVAGAHLVTGTERDVKFKVAARIPMQQRGKTGRLADALALSRGVAGFARAFDKLKPDFVLVLGDRIEPFAAASAASVGGFRVAHIHGGDRAEGVADEAMRHAISKLAHMHFAASALSRKRLLKMGEQHVYFTGSPAADGLNRVKPAKDAPQIIVLQHPIGADDAKERRWMRQTLAATEGFHRLVMGPNTDPGSAGIVAALPPNAVDHMARDRWLSMLAGARVLAGNSSAGLIEAAVLKTPVVNIGPRQGGRERPRNVIDCDYGEKEVRRAIKRAMKLDLDKLKHPYGDGRASKRIAKLLAAVSLETISVRKHNAY